MARVGKLAFSRLVGAARRRRCPIEASSADFRARASRRFTRKFVAGPKTYSAESWGARAGRFLKTKAMFAPWPCVRAGTTASCPVRLTVLAKPDHSSVPRGPSVRRRGWEKNLGGCACNQNERRAIRWRAHWAPANLTRRLQWSSTDQRTKGRRALRSLPRVVTWRRRVSLEQLPSHSHSPAGPNIVRRSTTKIRRHPSACLRRERRSQCGAIRSGRRVGTGCWCCTSGGPERRRAAGAARPDSPCQRNPFEEIAARLLEKQKLLPTYLAAASGINNETFGPVPIHRPATSVKGLLQERNVLPEWTDPAPDFLSNPPARAR